MSELERRLSEAGSDPEALWGVYEYCSSHALDTRAVLVKIIEVQPEDQRARGLLGHVRYDDRWFESPSQLDAYKREEDERMAAKGLTRFSSRLSDLSPQWVPIVDLAKYERGYLPLEDEGGWVRAEDKPKIDQGWQAFDLGWYPIEEWKKSEQGLFPCGGEWLSIEEADAFHSDINRWWEIPSERFVAYSTCSRKTSLWALWEADRTYPELKRIFGMDPYLPPVLVLLNGTQQYNAFAQGVPGMSVPETSGYSSIYHAFLCEAWVDVRRGEFPGAACAYWDEKSENGNSWGPLAVRHAAGQAFVEALDPSPRFVRSRVATPLNSQVSTEPFWREKKLPLWLRYGAAAYVERYFIDRGADNPLWTREWSTSMITQDGGLDDLAQIFAFPISPDNPGSGKLINQAGLLVAFVIDGKVPAVTTAHRAFTHALRSATGDDGSGIAKAAADLQVAITEHESQLREFAGF